MRQGWPPHGQDRKAGLVNNSPARSASEGRRPNFLSNQTLTEDRDSHNCICVNLPIRVRNFKVTTYFNRFFPDIHFPKPSLFPRSSLIDSSIFKQNERMDILPM